MHYRDEGNVAGFTKAATLRDPLEISERSGDLQGPLSVLCRVTITVVNTLIMIIVSKIQVIIFR